MTAGTVSPGSQAGETKAILNAAVQSLRDGVNRFEEQFKAAVPGLALDLETGRRPTP